MSALDSHKVEDFDLQKLDPASPKEYKKLWPQEKDGFYYGWESKCLGNIKIWDLLYSAGPLKFFIVLKRSGQKANIPRFPCKRFDIAESHSRKKGRWE